MPPRPPARGCRHKRIDTPIVDTGTFELGAVRFNCLKTIAGSESIFIRQFSLHKKIVPWEQPH